jgi:hypothetical protein
LTTETAQVEFELNVVVKTEVLTAQFVVEVENVNVPVPLPPVYVKVERSKPGDCR